MAANSSVPFFEGVEKRLQFDFVGTKLREKLTRALLETIVEPVECSIEGVLSGDHVDAYLLSASSLFVYDDMVIVKTCGETKIFGCIERILKAAGEQRPRNIKYTRGPFFRPELQPYPHQNPRDENLELESCLKTSTFLDVIESVTLGTLSNWFMTNASSTSTHSDTKNLVTVEMCMRQLDKEKASFFYQKADKRIINESGVGRIFPDAIVSDHEFQPCGFSMNTIEGHAVSTIHVSPQEESSYASFEAMGYDLSTQDKLSLVIERVLDCFNPNQFTLAIYSSVPLGDFDLNSLKGYDCKEKDFRSLCKGGYVLYFTFFNV